MSSCSIYFPLSVNSGEAQSSQFKKLMQKAGILTTITPKSQGKGRRFYSLSFHSLRHTFISMLANQGVPQDVRMKLTGHSAQVHSRYSHFDLEVLRKEVSILPVI